MTAARRDDCGTEFTNWLRDQDEIDSKRGFLGTDIDMIWRTKHGNLWMMLEEKRYGAVLKPHQTITFLALDTIFQGSNDPGYRGFHLIQFSKSSPEDGSIFLDGVEITRDQLIKFLRFEAPDSVYDSYRPPNWNENPEVTDAVLPLSGKEV